MTLFRYTAAALAAGALVVAAGCGAPASGDPAAATTTTAAATNGSTAPARHIDLHYAGGAAQGGVTQVAVPLGAAVVVTMSSDVAQEMHVHGYDLHADAPAGGTATVSFDATIPGIFEVEAEQTGTRLARLEVS